MTAIILDGRALAQELRAAAQSNITALSARIGRAPGLAVVQVLGDAASARYVRSIEKLCAAVGARCRVVALPADAAQVQLEVTIDELNVDPETDGILLQLPLPAHIGTDAAIMRIDHRKDVDGVHPINAGLLAQGRPALVPNTPAGGMELLRRYEIPLRGRRAAVIGRSAIVGRPMAQLLIQADATVTVCHSRTADLGPVLRECEIVCVAAGRPGLVTADMIRPGAVVVDFGTNVAADGSLVGDVDFAAVAEVAGAITPVPGGAGPMTNVMLIRNLIAAAQQ
ncbi:bifunctional 5,10-methylenetetrahydrofolate dehydrogenase/5,10-methenyltetrahydrofolate cyclohydrolase [Oscillochloris sp. ZM17-4]|uniref:bifunctional 5,10-methylenetetrahydrofolate dehydrogenase/5,10-methenyltetrahydrofolate cyclohydrolase n=1 Tax=Oscillochloris sp. ZM17-4 TaxID=2866714 RepID=UPI001C72C64A|nr:bifunctional 5,10-methylenetetrahydrofolate dehydrogenase/5,10-methenyltetrahydrofolate cyclohydrolase [Oscillochloris sp. ZM17-4]MBX0329510.1 bifunctional 5,10-methylenetetrahydrofolate dehydrogenase/5,10-methenyltetrahydrofolate cyclohydrolase [Oscillochloris sp. ZM17-4]